MTYPAHALEPHLATERRIIDRLIDGFFASEDAATMDVFDGEEWAVKRSSDPEAIKAECFATDVTVLHFRIDGDTLLGCVTLIHGNGHEVIGDWRWPGAHPEHEARMDAMVETAIEA
jgi:hypothetical protein